MSRTAFLPALVGTAALVALPVVVAAQTGGSTAQYPPPTTQHQAGTENTADSPREHLDLAKQTLDRIERDAVTGPNASKLNELRRHVAALDKSYKADSVPGSATGDTQRSTTGRERSAPSGQDNWNTHLMAADKTLNDLLGAASAGTSGSPSTEPGATGTTGSTPGSGMLDASVRAQLEEVRRHLTKFAAAASGTAASGSMASTPPSDPDATSATGATGTTGSTSQTGATGTPTQSQTTASGTQTTTGGTTGGQVNADVARESLTKARQSLADLTALPQAQQLQGETRSQVSQLISQFNTLITTQDNWQESYTQVEQTLNALLSGSTSAPATPPAGSVGTTGTAPAPLDPAVRSKLEEFRQHLQAFHAAAGGSAGASGSSTAGATTGTQTSGAQTGTTSTGMSSDVETHIAAIERIVNEALGTSSSATSSSTSTQTGATGTSGAAASGQVTIDRAKLEQIRMHLQQLRDSVRK